MIEYTDNVYAAMYNCRTYKVYGDYHLFIDFMYSLGFKCDVLIAPELNYRI